MSVLAGAGTDAYGILGYPLDHTASPPMHNAAFRALGLPAVYVPRPTPPAAFEVAVASLRGPGWCGANVTMPFKARALALADDVDEAARRAGGANTLRVRGGRIEATSTDGSGFLASLGDRPLRRALLLGGGGAARAVGTALLSAGAYVTVVARRPGAVAWLLPERGDVLPWSALASRASVPRADVIVQATPLGSAGSESPPFPAGACGSETLVVDLIYEPRRTSFLDAAARAGAETRNGLGMLLHQGAIAFEWWTGQPAPLAIMAEVIGLES